MATRTYAKTGGLAALVMLAMASSGCQIWYLLAPPIKVAPKYQFGEEYRVAILLDETAARIKSSRAKRMLVDEIGRQLVANKAIASATSYRDQTQLMMGHERYDRLEPHEIGKLLHADEVLVLEVAVFSMKDRWGDNVYHGRAGIDVAVYETKSGALRWQTEEMVKETRGTVPIENTTRQPDGIARSMAAKLADTIAKLFYEYEIQTDEEHRYKGPSE